MSSKPGEAVIAGDGPYVLLTQTPEMYLLHKGDGTVWCRWPDNSFVEVVPKAKLDEAELAASVAGTEEGAFWKGHDNATHGVAMRWRQALEAPIPAPGVMNEPLESLYRRTEALRAALEQIESCPDDSTVLRNIARDALRKKEKP